MNSEHKHTTPVTFADRLIGFGVWTMLGGAFLLVLFSVIPAVWETGLSTKVHNTIYFLLIGAVLLLQGGIMLYLNLGKKDDFVAVAPYAGKQNVPKKWMALAAASVLALLGVVCLLAPLTF